MSTEVPLDLTKLILLESSHWGLLVPWMGLTSTKHRQAFLSPPQSAEATAFWQTLFIRKIDPGFSKSIEEYQERTGDKTSTFDKCIDACRTQSNLIRGLHWPQLVITTPVEDAQLKYQVSGSLVIAQYTTSSFHGSQSWTTVLGTRLIRLADGDLLQHRDTSVPDAFLLSRNNIINIVTESTTIGNIDENTLQRVLISAEVHHQFLFSRYSWDGIESISAVDSCPIPGLPDVASVSRDRNGGEEYEAIAFLDSSKAQFVAHVPFLKGGAYHNISSRSCTFTAGHLYIFDSEPSSPTIYHFDVATIMAGKPESEYRHKFVAQVTKLWSSPPIAFGPRIILKTAELGEEKFELIDAPSGARAVLPESDFATFQNAKYTMGRNLLIAWSKSETVIYHVPERLGGPLEILSRWPHSMAVSLHGNHLLLNRGKKLWWANFSKPCLGRLFTAFVATPNLTEIKLSGGLIGALISDPNQIRRLQHQEAWLLKISVAKPPADATDRLSERLRKLIELGGVVYVKIHSGRTESTTIKAGNVLELPYCGPLDITLPEAERIKLM